MASESIETVMQAHADDLMALPGVEGIGVGLCGGSPCIKVYVVRPPLPKDGPVPACIDGYPVRIEVTGAVEPRLDE